MKVNAALCFILLGISLWLCLKDKKASQENRNNYLQALGVVCTSIVVIIGLLTLLEYLLNWNFGIDEFWVGDFFVERMSLTGALNFMLLGRSLQLLIKPKTSRSYWYAQVLTLIAALVSTEAIIGHFYKVKFFYEFVPYIKSLELNTALLFILFSSAILFTCQNQGLMKVLTRDTYAALLARRLLLAAIVIPLLLGWLILQGQRSGFYDAGFAISLLVTVLILSFCVLIWQNAALVAGVSEERDRIQEKLKSFVNANLIGIVFGDVENNIYKANDEFLRIIGYSREDLEAGIITAITPPEYLDLDRKGIAEAKLKGACTPYEKEYIRQDGSRIPILVGYTLVGENREESVAFILDLSQTYQKEQQLREAHRQTTDILESISDAFVTLDHQLCYSYVNHKAEEVLGKTQAQLLGKNVWQVFTPSWDSPCYNYLTQALAEQVSIFYEEFYLPLNKWFSVRLYPSQAGISIYFLDITNRKQIESALRQSEERFRLALDNIPDVFVMYNQQRRIQFANVAALERVKKPITEILGRTDEEIFTDEVTQPYLATLIKAQETGTIQSIEATIALDGHNKFTTQIKYVPLLNENGEISQILGFINDITEHKQIEETLQNQQKWLEDLLNLMPTPLLLIEPATARVIFANKAADEVAGGNFPKAQSVAEYQTFYYSVDSAGNRIPNEQAPGVRLARGEQIHGFELDWHTPVGIRSLLVFGNTLPAMHGHSAICMLVFQDITKVKQVEKALSLNNRRLQLLFETASELLSSQEPLALIEILYRKISEQINLDVYFNYLVNEDKQLLQLESYTGISQEVAKEIEWLDFGQAVCGTVAEEQHQITVQNVQQSTESKTKLIRSLGIQAYSSQPLIAQGRLLGTLSFGSRSLTKFTQNEMAMMQAVCDQIAVAVERSQLIASLQQQTEYLQQANKMKDEFLAILSHELRSPLNAILGWVQILRSRHQLDEAKKALALETIERNARAQTQLIEDLLDISRIVRGQLRLNVGNVELTPIINSVVNSLRLAAEAKKIHLEMKIEHNMQSITGDTGRLQQIIWNLLSNAIKFTPNGGRVDITLSTIPESNESETNQSFAQITVSDTGVGIKPEFLPYVFDRFRQADSSSTRSYGGLGLGLAIVRNLVELHGGTVDVESPGEGRGATFTVKLPLLIKDNQPNQNIQ